MEFVSIGSAEEERRAYMELLLMADEQESMVDRYLMRGEMFVLRDGGAGCGVCLVTDEGDGTAEIKNLAVAPECRRRGLGRGMIRMAEERCRGRFRRLVVGTGDSPLTVPFYERCGFVRSHAVKDFFFDNYDSPIFEGGVWLRDMIYFVKEL